MFRKTKKILVLLVSLALILSIVGCSKSDESLDGSGIYEPGTYVGVGNGHNGEVKVEVSFDSDKIKSVKIIEHEETESISSTAMERIPEEIVEKQSLDIDSLAGASYTSLAILEAVKDAVVQAGGDPDALNSANENDIGEKLEKEMTTDVVVVGAGGTGLAAAASAHEHGAKVIVVEKLAMTGGSTALSGGAIAAPGSRFQKELDIEDSKEDWMELWKKRQSFGRKSDYPDYDRVDKFMDEAVETTHWMTDYIGLEFESIDGFGFDPVRRLHTPPKGGSGITTSIEEFLDKEGIEVLTETPAIELITNEDGDVVGVVAESSDEIISIKAEKVILASGGFAKNEELLERLVPEMKESGELSAAAAGSKGDGILMAEEVGAALYEDNWIIGLGYTSKVPELSAFDWDSTKILVNEKGNRFMNESSHYALVTNEVAKEEKVWMIIDSNEENSKVIESIKDKLDSEEIVQGDTIEDLAREMDVDPSNLGKTIKSFNEGVEAGEDEFGKPEEMLVPLGEGPFYAFREYPRTMGTFAGVKTDEKYRVLRENGSLINNLYAGGECANRPLYNQVYMTGSSVQFALTSGRIAGEDAAKSLK